MSKDLELGPYSVYVHEMKDRYIVYFSSGIFNGLDNKSIELPKEVKE